VVGSELVPLWGTEKFVAMHFTTGNLPTFNTLRRKKFSGKSFCGNTSKKLFIEKDFISGEFFCEQKKFFEIKVTGTVSIFG
jgi:hypothetical protein